MATTNVRFLEYSTADGSDLNAGQMGFQTSNDADLGYKMIIGKDHGGTVHNFLAKNEDIKVDDVYLTWTTGTSKLYGDNSDGNTYIDFQSDKIQLVAGGITAINITEDTTDSITLGMDLVPNGNLIKAGGTTDLTLQLSDNAGAKKLIVEDSDGTNLFEIDSDGACEVNVAEANVDFIVNANGTGSVFKVDGTGDVEINPIATGRFAFNTLNVDADFIIYDRGGYIPFQYDCGVNELYIDAPTRLGENYSSWTLESNVPFLMHDNRRFSLGTDSDAYIQYDETTNDRLEIIAAGRDILISGEDGGDTGQTYIDLIVDDNTSGGIRMISGSNTIVGMEASSLAIDVSQSQAAEAFSISLPDNTAGVLAITESSNDYLTIDTTNGSELIELHKDVKLNGDIYTTAWTDYSGTSTIVGWSSYTTKLIYYKKVGNLVFVSYDIAGPSDETTGTIATFTLPYTSSNTVQTLACGLTTDNGTPTTTGGAINLTQNNSTVAIYKDMSTTNLWTDSGTKQIIGQFWYEAA